MIVMEKSPELDVRSGCEAELVVKLADISFQDLPGNRVRISVRIHNEGVGRSRPTVVRLESAPFGAFVPWKPFAVLPIPAIEPGESHEVSTEATRPRPVPLGNFDRIPPKTLLTALNAPDQPEPRSEKEPLTSTLRAFHLRKKAAWLARTAGGFNSRAASRVTVLNNLLAPDLWDFVGRDQLHWAGNVNVFIGKTPVERHRAKALRVYPGRTNLAMFIVGGEKPDAYAFEIVGLNPDWKAVLYNATNRQTLVVQSSDQPIEEMQWVEAAGKLMIMLATRPPAGCQEGNVEVHVTRRSCQTSAVVEFDLDPAAQGPGCYYA